MTSGRVLLLRHGETEWNAASRWQGHGGAGLSAHGRMQAQWTAQFLATARPDITAVVRSDLERVVETTAPLIQRCALPVSVDARWREIDVGTWSGRTHEEVRAVDPLGYEAWRAGGDPRRGGGETDAELRARVAAALADLSAMSGTVLVVTHGGPVRHAVAQALGLPPGGHRRLANVGNCSLSELSELSESVAGRWSLMAYNDRSHARPSAGSGWEHDKGRASAARPSPA